jgi:hypothetical protein
MRLIFRRPEGDHLSTLDVAPGTTVGVFRAAAPDHRVFVRVDGDRHALGVRDQSISTLDGGDAPIEFDVFDGMARIHNNYNVDTPSVSGKYADSDVAEGEAHEVTDYADLVLGFNVSATLVFPGESVTGRESAGQGSMTRSFTAQQRRTLRTVSDTRVAVIDPETPPERVARQLDELIGDVEHVRGLDAADLSEFKKNLEYFESRSFGDGVVENEREELRRHLKRLEQDLLAAFDDAVAGRGSDRT